MDQVAQLFHDRGILLIQFGRMTITVKDAGRESVNADLEMAGFIPLEHWRRGKAIDTVIVRRKEHRWDRQKAVIG